MATVVWLEYVGLEAFSREGTKLGKIKQVLGDHDSGAEYLVIGRRLSRDLVIPAAMVEPPGDRVVVPRASSFLNCAPVVNTKGVISPEDAGRLRTFYATSAT